MTSQTLLMSGSRISVSADNQQGYQKKLNKLLGENEHSFPLEIGDQVSIRNGNVVEVKGRFGVVFYVTEEMCLGGEVIKIFLLLISQCGYISDISVAGELISVGTLVVGKKSQVTGIKPDGSLFQFSIGE